MNDLDFKIEYDTGKGRAFIVFASSSELSKVKATLESNLPSSGRQMMIACPNPDAKEWKAQAEKLFELILSNGVRQFTGIAFGHSNMFLQYIALKDPKLVRSLVMIDPVIETPDTLASQIATSIEKYLPLGLPLRSESGIFDIRPFLQRIRSPILTIRMSDSGESKEDAHIVSTLAPTAWECRLGDLNKIGEVVSEFEKVPAKCPQ